MDTRYVERTPPTGSFPMRFSPAVGAPKATPRRAKPGSWGTPGETWGPTTTLEASSMLSHLLDAQPTLFWASSPAFEGLLEGLTVAHGSPPEEDALGRLPWEAAGPHRPCERAGGLPAPADLQQVVRPGPLGALDRGGWGLSSGQEVRQVGHLRGRSGQWNHSKRGKKRGKDLDKPTMVL